MKQDELLQCIKDDVGPPLDALAEKGYVIACVILPANKSPDGTLHVSDVGGAFVLGHASDVEESLARRCAMEIVSRVMQQRLRGIN